MDAPVRALTVTALYLSPESDICTQFDLMGGAAREKREKLSRLEHTMDNIRAKFGKGAISPASTPSDPGRERHAPPPGSHHDG